MLLGKRILQSNFAGLDKPYKLTFAATSKCSSKCRNCMIWKEGRKKEIALNEIRKFFENNNYFSWIDITGGEIFERKDIVEIARIIIENCKNLYLLHYPTNAENVRRTVEKTKEILKLKPNRLIVSVSLDGPPEVHDKLRGLKGSWKRSMQAYKEMKMLEKENSNFSVFFGMTISNDNYNLINETISSIRKEVLGFRSSDLHINLFHYSEHYYKNKPEKLKTKEIAEAVSSFRRKAAFSANPVRILEQKYLKLMPEYLETGKTPIACEALSASCFISCEGDVYPCTSYNKKIGNIKNLSLELLWKDKKVIDLRKEIQKKNCPNCWTPCEAYQSMLANLHRML